MSARPAVDGSEAPGDADPVDGDPAGDALQPATMRSSATIEEMWRAGACRCRRAGRGLVRGVARGSFTGFLQGGLAGWRCSHARQPTIPATLAGWSGRAGSHVRAVPRRGGRRASRGTAALGRRRRSRRVRACGADDRHAADGGQTDRQQERRGQSAGTRQMPGAGSLIRLSGRLCEVIVLHLDRLSGVGVGDCIDVSALPQPAGPILSVGLRDACGPAQAPPAVRKL